jgi:hypothetical protein
MTANNERSRTSGRRGLGYFTSAAGLLQPSKEEQMHPSIIRGRRSVTQPIIY